MWDTRYVREFVELEKQQIQVASFCCSCTLKVPFYDVDHLQHRTFSFTPFLLLPDFRSKEGLYATLNAEVSTFFMVKRSLEVVHAFLKTPPSFCLGARPLLRRRAFRCSFFPRGSWPIL